MPRHGHRRENPDYSSSYEGYSDEEEGRRRGRRHRRDEDSSSSQEIRHWDDLDDEPDDDDEESGDGYDSRSDSDRDDSDDESLLSSSSRESADAPRHHHKAKHKTKKRRRGLVLAGVAVVLIAGGAWWFLAQGPAAGASAAAATGSSDAGQDSSDGLGDIVPVGFTQPDSSSSDTGSAATPSASSGGTSSKKLGELKPWFRAAYWQCYAGVPVSATPFGEYDLFFFFTTEPKEDGSLSWGGCEKDVQAFVEGAHGAGSKVVLTVGGWTGSKFFSPLVKEGSKRDAFVEACVKAMDDGNFDGLDFDWEYPGRPGQEGNIVDEARDTANFLAFLQAIRAHDKMSGKLLSAATAQAPFSVDGKPSNDVGAFKDVFDFLAPMTYDSIMPDNPISGPNIALSSPCAPQELKGIGSMETSIQSWIDAGFPASQLLVGIPYYGYSFKLAGGFKEGGVSEGGRSGIYQTASGAADPRSYTWKQLQDVLNGQGFTKVFDECTSTPYAYSGDRIIPYDDPQSIAAKAGWAKEKGLLGAMIFPVDGDDESNTLAKALVV